MITRAGVLPMTLTAGAVAGLLAVRHHGFAAGWFALSFVGIVLAHVSNNLLNDLLDTDTGLDSDQLPPSPLRTPPDPVRDDQPRTVCSGRRWPSTWLTW